MLSSRKWFLNFLFRLFIPQIQRVNWLYLMGFFHPSLCWINSLSLPHPHTSQLHPFLSFSIAISISLLFPLFLLSSSFLSSVGFFPVWDQKKKLQLISHLLNLDDIFLVLAESPVVWLLHCVPVVSFDCHWLALEAPNREAIWSVCLIGLVWQSSLTVDSNLLVAAQINGNPRSRNFDYCLLAFMPWWLVLLPWISSCF